MRNSLLLSRMKLFLENVLWKSFSAPDTMLTEILMKHITINRINIFTIRKLKKNKFKVPTSQFYGIKFIPYWMFKFYYTIII